MKQAHKSAGDDDGQPQAKKPFQQVKKIREINFLFTNNDLLKLTFSFVAIWRVFSVKPIIYNFICKNVTFTKFLRETKSLWK